MGPFNFFQTILYISLPERSDRRILMLQEFFIVDMPHFKMIEGVKNSAGSINDGFNQAQHNALLAAKGDTLILEDDVIFEPKNDGMLHKLELALDELPEDWDLVYLGANVVGTDLCSWPVPERYSDHLNRVTQAWTTHAIGYSEKGAKWILDNWDYTSGQMYDDFLRCNLEKLQAFIVNPMVADQRKGYSDIWQRHTDYGFFNVWKHG